MWSVPDTQTLAVGMGLQMVPASSNNKYPPRMAWSRSCSLPASMTLSKYWAPLRYSPTVGGAPSLHFSGLAVPKSMAPLFLPFLSHSLHVSPVVALLSSKLSKQHLFVCASAKDSTRVSEGMPPGTFLELDGNFCPFMGWATVGSLFGTYTDLTSPRSASLTSCTIPQHSLTTRCKEFKDK